MLLLNQVWLGLQQHIVLRWPLVTLQQQQKLTCNLMAWLTGPQTCVTRHLCGRTYGRKSAVCKQQHSFSTTTHLVDECQLQCDWTVALASLFSQNHPELQLELRSAVLHAHKTLLTSSVSPVPRQGACQEKPWLQEVLARQLDRDNHIS